MTTATVLDGRIKGGETSIASLKADEPSSQNTFSLTSVFK